MTITINPEAWYTIVQVPRGSGRQRASVHSGFSLMGETPEDSERVTPADHPRYTEYVDEYLTEDEAIAAARDARAN